MTRKYPSCSSITSIRLLWTMKKKDEMPMNKTDMIMLRCIEGVSLRNHIRNEEIREAATVQPITTHLMQTLLRWYGHVKVIIAIYKKYY